VYLVRYEGEVSLPQINSGYWVVYDRCCRPGGIINLNNSGAQGFSYTSWIPADSNGIISNSTAQFTDTLLNFICRTDTAYISNLAVDPDGDSLVYTLVTPFRGKSGNGNGGNPPPNPTYNSALMNPYDIPPPQVTWAVGYNLTNLLGPGSFSSTNPNNGLTKFFTNNQGVYVAAVEITEYRNGQIVGVSRRNMQLISDNCPNNNQPTQNTSVLDPSAIAPLIYQVNAGDSFCFNLNYTDLDTDLLSFTASGDIFDPTITNPPATNNGPVQGNGSVTGTICWGTSCEQGSIIPYIFDVIVVDSNCPPLPFPHEVEIRVLPYTGLNSIFGDSISCVTSLPSIYSTNPLPNTSYSWTVTGGNIASGNGTSSIGIVWNSGVTTGTISVSSSNNFGCTIGPIVKTVTVVNNIADAGPDVFLCDGDSVQIGGSPTSMDSTNSILWTPGTTLSNDTVSNPFASPTSSQSYILTLTNALGCIGTDTVNVTVNNLQPSGLFDEYYVCPGDSAEPIAQGDSFSWSPNYFISDTTIANPLIFPPNDTTYFLSYTDTNGCPGEDTIFITVNPVVPTDAGPDAHICVGDSVVLGGSPTSPPNTTFLWSPNSFLSSNTDANPTAQPNGTVTYFVETFNDTCKGLDTVVVTVNPPPPLSVSADTLICSGDSVLLIAQGIGSFSWTNGNTLSSDTIGNPIAFPTDSTNYVITLTDSIGCENVDSILVAVQALPVIDAGGIINACQFDSISLGGNPTGPSNIIYQWSPALFIDSAQVQNPKYFGDQDITYYLIATDSIGCISIDSAQVKVFKAFGLPDTTLCTNTNYILQTTLVNGVPPFSFQWTNPGTLSNPNSGSPSTIVGLANTYSVTVSDGNGCTDTVAFSIDYYAETNADFEYKTILNCEGYFVQMTNLSTGAMDFQWYLNGSPSGNEENPEFVLPFGDSTVIELLTISSDGCVDTARAVFTVPNFEESLQIETVNVFTPNGDGENDYFAISTAGDLSNCAELSIYNRHGVLVYQSYGGIYSWDGYSPSGKPHPEGVYFYVYSVNGVEKHGNITLMR
jgi:gliding motility-associated-like protein